MSTNYKKGMLKTTIIYFIGQMSTRFLSILLLPLYTNYISSEAYGYFDIVQTYLNVAVPFLFFEVWSAMLRFTLEQKESSDKARVITNSTVICSIGLVLFCAVFWIAALFIEIDYAPYVFAYAVSWMLQLMAMAACRGLQDNISYALTGVIGVFVVTGLSLLGVFVFHWGIETLFIANIASFLIQALFVMFRVRFFRYIRPRLFDRGIFKQILKFCIPLSINTIFYWLLNSVNRIIIVEFLGYSANGVYSVANKLGNIITALVAIFMLSWQETVYKLDYQENNEIQLIYDNEFKNIKSLLAMGVLCLLPFTNVFFDLLIGADYAEAFGLIAPMYLMVFITSLNSFIDVVYSAVHDTRSLLYVKIIGGVVNVAVMLLLVKFIGLYASPIAIILAQIAALIANKFFLRRYVRITIGIRFILVFGLVFALSSFIYMTQGKWINGSWLVLCGVGCLFILRKNLLQVFILLKSRFKHAKDKEND